MNIYVGNISYSISEAQLSDTFSEFGTVTSIKMIINKRTGKSKGYGFVEMENESEGLRAVEELNGRELDGRSLRVIKAHSETGEVQQTKPESIEVKQPELEVVEAY